MQKPNAYQMWNNGQGWQAYGDLNLRTWYQSDLALRLRSATDLADNTPVVERSRNQRGVLVVSELAQNLKGRPLEGLTRPTGASEWGATMATRLKRDFDCVGIDYNAFYPGETRLQALEELQSAPEVNEYQVFFYHSDHASTTLSTSLGSSSFITDANGDATQHLQYTCTELVECVPFGEDWSLSGAGRWSLSGVEGWSLSGVEGHEQNTAAYLSPYTFSGKERDVETNLSYFGARYYESSLSVWLSVDPMSDKYPSLSAYNYCALNPVMLVDPDGREIEEGSQEAWKKHKTNIANKIESLKTLSAIYGEKSPLTKNLNDRISMLTGTLDGMSAMEESNQCYRLTEAKSSFGTNTMTQDGVIEISTNGQTSNFVHEVTHSIQYERNQLGFLPGTSSTVSSLQNEVEAYKTELAFSGSLSNGFTSFSAITPNWVRGITSGGQQLYSKQAAIPVSPTLGQAGINIAYPGNTLNVMPNETLRDVFPTVKWKK